MANLGTLWFGADIDLTALKQKIQQGNQSILSALKIDYDPASYQQMVNDLKHRLARETFEIKLSTNVKSLSQSIQGSKKGTIVGGLDEMSDKIVRQEALVNDLRATVARLNAEYNKLGGVSRKSRLEDSRAELANEKAALDTLKATRREYTRATQQSTQAKRQAAEAARQLNSDHLRLNTTLAGGIHVSTQLGSALSSLFAVHAAKEFLNNVIEIGGQLEKQRISMGAIVGDTARANELFENIKNLAIKSPFGVVELDQYSKQLAAYGIEQSDLFDMTKRLADISAGAGQDIGRLALALGHVKSATYLTGITLRQFSMNNIPMLKMLADYYSEVEQRAVSTAEVQKRISKRQVSYEDVVEQMKRMTDEGGKFFNMQEKISESLQAKFKNLRDSFDIMYGEIAESQIGGMLKSFASGATEMSRNWRQVITIIGEAAVVFGIYRTAIIATNWATNNLNANTIAAALSNGKLSASMIDRYVKTGQITKAQLLQAVATKKVTAADAELAAATFGVTRAQLDQIAASGRYKGMLAQTTLATSRFTFSQLRLMAALRSGSLSVFTKGLAGLRLGFSLVGTAAKTAAMSVASFLAPLAGFAAFSLIIDTFMESERKAEETEERLRSMAETANEAYKNMSEVREKFKVGASSGMKDNELQTNITEMVEHLQNYSKTAKETFNNAFEVNSEGKAVHSLSEQYEILAKAIDETTDAYRAFNDLRPMIEHSLEVNTPNEGFFKRLGNKMYSWLLEDANKAPLRDLSESLAFYAESVKKASVAEQLFLRNRLDVQRALADNGYKQALDMDNESLLTLIKTVRDESPEAFAKFYQMLTEDGKNALNGMTEAWGVMDKSWMEANLKMRRTGEDLFKTLSTAYGTSDMSQWPSTWREVVHIAMDAATKDVKGFADLSVDYQNYVRNSFLRPFKIEVDSNEAQKQVNNLLVDLQNLVGKDWVVQIGIKGVSSIEDVDAASKTYKQAVGNVESTTKRLLKLEKEGKKGTEAYKQTLKDQEEAIAMRDKSMQTLSAYGADLPSTDKKTSGGSKADKQLEEWKKQISLLDKYRQELDKLSKYMTRKEAEIKLQADGNFSSLFGIFSNPNDYVGSLNEMIRKLGSSGARGDYAKELFSKIGEEGLRRFTEDADNATSELQRMLDVMQENYNTYKRWLELTGDKKLAAQIAGVSENTSYYDYLKDQYRQLGGLMEKSSDEFFSLSESKAKEYGEKNGLFALWKEWQENSKKIKEEDLKLYENAIKNSKDYEDRIADINRELEREIEAIRKLNKDEQEQQRLIDNAKKNANKKVADEAWKNFKETSDWGRVFGDLDKMSTDTLQAMLDKLHEVAPTINDSVEATKALYEAIDKIDKVMADRNPLAAFGNASKKANMAALMRKEAKQFRSEGYIAAADERDREAADLEREAMEDFGKGMDGLSKKFKTVQDALSPVITLFETLGDEGLSNFFKMGSDALGAASQMGNGAAALFGTAAGPWGAAAGAALSVISSVVAMHDESLQKEIEASKARQKEMENLTKNLETALERTLGGIYNTKAGNNVLDSLAKEIANPFKGLNIKGVFGGLLDTDSDYRSYIGEDTIKAVENAEKTKSYYDAIYASLLAQRDELQHQMQAEEDKKDSDSERIADYKQQIIEMQDEIDNFAKDMAKNLWDIDVKSWAKTLTETIVDAWKKGEDAVDAYKNKVREMMLDLTTNILSQKIMEKALEEIGLDDLIANIMKSTKGELDVDSVEELADALNSAGENSAKAITAILDSMEMKGYLSRDEETKSSSASSSIKGITEQTADLLASYVNAIRADLSVVRGTQAIYLPSIATAVQHTSAMADIQVMNLQQIADNTRRNADAADKIYDIMHKIDTGVTAIKMK